MPSIDPDAWVVIADLYFIFWFQVFGVGRGRWRSLGSILGLPFWQRKDNQGKTGGFVLPGREAAARWLMAGEAGQPSTFNRLIWAAKRPSLCRKRP